jgi:hypothetical protein
MVIKRYIESELEFEPTAYFERYQIHDVMQVISLYI